MQALSLPSTLLSTPQPFLEPMTIYGAPVTPVQLGLTAVWLKSVTRAISGIKGASYRPLTPGVSLQRFGWEDLRRVFYASRIKRSDCRKIDSALAFVALRDGRLVEIHTGLAVGTLDVVEPVTLRLWMPPDWEAFMAEVHTYTLDVDDDDRVRTHLSLCGTIID